MTNRALLVGINKYPDAPLNGCINDVEDMIHHITTHCGFKATEITTLLDGAATTKAILAALQTLVKGLKAGDRVLFHYSGHGAQAPTKSSTGEVDGLDEVICPVDFDWSDALMIRDKDLHRVLAQVPVGVNFVWVSDSCHSGDLFKSMKGGPLETYCVPRAMPVPSMIALEQFQAKDMGFQVSRLAKAASLNVAFISGCGSRQTSADAYFRGRYNGALSYYLIHKLVKNQNLSLTQAVQSVREDLAKAGFDQVPEIHGQQALLSHPFFG